MELGSATLSVASPAVETTVAVVEARYVLVIPGVNAPNCAGAPSNRLNVAATEPPTVPGVSTCGINRSDFTADTLPLKSTAIHFNVVSAGRSSGSGSARARVGFHSVDAVVGVEPSVV